MKKVFLLAIATLILITPSFCLAVNTTTVGSSLKVIQIVPDGITNWVWEDDIAAISTLSDRELSRVKASKVKRVVFYPSASNDRMILHDGGLDNAAFFDSGLVSGADDPRTVVYDPPEKVKLVLDASDNTTSTAADCKVLIYLDN